MYQLDRDTLENALVNAIDMLNEYVALNLILEELGLSKEDYNDLVGDTVVK